MPSRTFTDSVTWYASLPTLYAAAAALITSEPGHVLLVKPNYRDHWSLPGGILEHGEPPHAGCAREVAEELGLDLTPGPLLVVQWVPPDAERPRPFVFFVFDGGRTSPGTPIKLQAEELDDYHFVPVEQFPEYLPPFVLARVSAAVRALETGVPVYLPADRG
ncbi:MAG TPA: NUDIX hydrolase [Streptosporangiaceae bacterium]|nr:NUDIX hydrolase [Streptosporangiaceae bacterium]